MQKKIFIKKLFIHFVGPCKKRKKWIIFTYGPVKTKGFSTNFDINMIG